MRLVLLSLPLITLLVILAHVAQAVDTISIFIVPMAPNWPVTMAAVVPESIKLQNPTFSWSYPTAQNPSCTVNGQINTSPCQGRVVDHWFPEGTHEVRLIVTDATLATPIAISVSIEIKPFRSYPVSHRPEIRMVSKDVWQQKYVHAFYVLKSTGVYDHLSRIHRATFSVGVVPNSGTQRSSAHSGPSFLPWHRISMRIVERCLQVAADDDEIGLPYWDWMKGYDGIDAYMG